MSQSRRKQDAPKHRKKILRKMKKLAKLVAAHGQRYYDLLDEKWETTSWSVLAHNLWTLGTMARKARREKEATSLDKAA